MTEVASVNLNTLVDGTEWSAMEQTDCCLNVQVDLKERHSGTPKLTPRPSHACSTVTWAVTVFFHCDPGSDCVLAL